MLRATTCWAPDPVGDMPPKKERVSPSVAARRKFAARLVAIRVAAGFESKAAFARALGVGGETYNRWERGETEPNIFNLGKIRSLTGASLDFLIAGVPTATAATVEEEKPPPQRRPFTAA